MGKTLLLSFDVEQFPSKEFGIPFDESAAFDVGNQGLIRILDLLKVEGVQATFFVTGEFSEKYPNSISRIVGEGHELALHGASHDHAYHTMEGGKALKVLREARLTMESTFKTDVLGFRGPRMSRPAYNILRECGFYYDSSLHPTYIPGRYNNLLAPRGIHQRDSIHVVPVSTSPIIRLPLSWLWFRRMGLLYTKSVARTAMIDKSFLHLYFHPWEFVEPPIHLNTIKGRVIIGGSGRGNLTQLGRLISWANGKGLKARTITSFLSEEVKYSPERNE